MNVSRIIVRSVWKPDSSNSVNVPHPQPAPAWVWLTYRHPGHRLPSRTMLQVRALCVRHHHQRTCVLLDVLLADLWMCDWAAMTSESPEPV